MEKKPDRRTRKTKMQLRQGLTTLLQQKSIKEITVKELAELVDINRSTFYIHYKDIFDLLDSIENEMMEDFVSLLNQHYTDSDNPHPFPLLRDVFHFLADYSDMCIVLLGKNGDIAFVDRLKEIVRYKCLHDWFTVLRKDDARYYEYYYAFIVSGCIGLLQSWLENGMQESPDKIAQTAEEMILGGLSAL